MEFWLYAELENNEELIKFLQKEESRKQQGYPILFEVDYALDVCRRKCSSFMEIYDNDPDSMIAPKMLKKIQLMRKAQIILYGILNLYSKAVKLALECSDITLAQDYANKPLEHKTKKKLWMKIAKYLFKAQNPQDNDRMTEMGTMARRNTITQNKREINVEEALKIIRNYNVLKVQDLLHLFPQDAKVEEMKQHLC
jgi:hypothetical protein